MDIETAKKNSFMNIEAERARKGWTNSQLAEAVGVTRRTLYQWMEKGDMPASALIKMSQIFGKSVDYLLGISDI